MPATMPAIVSIMILVLTVLVFRIKSADFRQTALLRTLGVGSLIVVALQVVLGAAIVKNGLLAWIIVSNSNHWILYCPFGGRKSLSKPHSLFYSGSLASWTRFIAVAYHSRSRFGHGHGNRVCLAQSVAPLFPRTRFFFAFALSLYGVQVVLGILMLLTGTPTILIAFHEPIGASIQVLLFAAAITENGVGAERGIPAS